ncbi:MAG: VCBS repeat-containing protein, partial [Myxococcota bacterium]
GGEIELRLVPTQNSWRVDRFRTVELAGSTFDRLLFADITAERLDPQTKRRAQHSPHETAFLERLGAPSPWPSNFLAPSDARHPSLAIADVDGDGLDDIYLTGRDATNQLLVHEDGRLVDRAPSWGLDLDDTNAALFVDLDNDGDLDAVLGHYDRPTQVLLREGRRYVDRTGDVFLDAAPALVTSISAADVDGDGWLDLYFSTYDAVSAHAQLSSSEDVFPFEKLGRRDEHRLRRAFEDERRHAYKNLPGPPNALFLNARGKLRRSTQLQVEATKNTFQVGFSDIDGDGDQDLYLAHDFAQDELFFNEGGVFVAAADGVLPSMLGFGMGVSFGDYDGDGDFDLYVTNMYSTAGNRVLDQLGAHADRALLDMAKGNFLFRNEGGRMELASGSGPTELHVEKAGWSWGGFFFDVDSDGDLDIHAGSGFFSVPKKYDAAFDT